MSSILTTTKKALGIAAADTGFDPELIMYINTVLSTLTQIGVGSSEGCIITSATDDWSDFIADEPKWEQVKTYVYTKVRLLFDPPQSSAAVEALNKIASELEWRIYVTANNTNEIEEETSS
jgi:hypothetical protein